MATAVQRRVDDCCNGSMESKSYTDLEHILEVIFDPGTWRYGRTITEIGKTRRDFGGGGRGGGEGQYDEGGVVRRGIKNFDLIKLHLGVY